MTIVEAIYDARERHIRESRQTPWLMEVGHGAMTRFIAGIQQFLTLEMDRRLKNAEDLGRMYGPEHQKGATDLAKLAYERDLEAWTKNYPPRMIFGMTVRQTPGNRIFLVGNGQRTEITG